MTPRTVVQSVPAGGRGRRTRREGAGDPPAPRRARLRRAAGRRHREGETPSRLSSASCAEECTLDGEVARAAARGRPRRPACLVLPGHRRRGRAGARGRGGRGPGRDQQPPPDVGQPEGPRADGPAARGADRAGRRLAVATASCAWPRRRRLAGRRATVAALQPRPLRVPGHDARRPTAPSGAATWRRTRPTTRDVVAYLAEQGDRPVGFALVRGRRARRTGDGGVLRRAVGPRPRAGQSASPSTSCARTRDRGRSPSRTTTSGRRGSGDGWVPSVLTARPEDARPIPDKPYLPPDRWLTGTAPG